ncbi:MAG: sterol desaturase family protein [Ignavibacteria bacterium]|nr:sterol desaturase family protein [Ignavibacteria bacterium]
MGAHFVSNKDEAVRIFKNPVLEYFSHIHPITPVVVFVPVIVWMVYLSLYVSTVWLTTGVFVVGVLLWTLTEYCIHRFGFHLHPTTELGKKIHFLVHGIHHAYPRDSSRLVMPPVVSGPLAILFYFVFLMLFEPYHYAMLAGYVFGYVAYDSIHFATHHFPMTNRIGRFLKEYHMKHHFADDNTAYGVSSPLWDYVFNTVPQWIRDRRRTKTQNAN